MVSKISLRQQLKNYKKLNGSITQTVECMLCKHKDIGSSPITSKRSLQVGIEPTTL